MAENKFQKVDLDNVEERKDARKKLMGTDPIIAECRTMDGTFQARVQPNCAAEDYSVMRYGFVFERKNYLGKGLDTVYTTTNNDEIIFLHKLFIPRNFLILICGRDGRI